MSSGAWHSGRVDRTGLIVAVAVLVLGVAAGWWRRRTDGRVAAGAPARERPVDAGLLASLGVAGGGPTLLQFSSAVCAPCRAVRRVSAQVAAENPGVRHVEVDAESHLEAVRALDIWRTPTVLILDSGGRITGRATGVPSKQELAAALAGLTPGDS